MPKDFILMSGSSGDELETSRGMTTNLDQIALAHQNGPFSSPDKYNDRFKIQTTEQFLTKMALLNSPQEIEIRNGSAVTRTFVPQGVRFGPYPVRWTNEPIDIRGAWEVVAGSTNRGWFELHPETASWTRKMRIAKTQSESNLQHILIAGYLWYEVTRDISSDTELVGAPKVPLQIKDLLPDERNDRDNGSQHSGTAEEDLNTSNDLDFSSKQDQDRDQDSDDEEGIDCRCFVCERQCHDIDQLDEHLVISHNYPRNSFPCELCDKSYCYRPTLLRHRSLVHGELRKYPCENCPKVFTDPSNLTRHIRSHHVGARSHACPECGKTFATSSGLKQHTHIHSSVKPFQCEVCFKAYTQFSNLCRHKRMHADCRMQIKCTKCGQSFSTVTSLSKHKRFCDSTNGHVSHLTSPTGGQSQTNNLPPTMTSPPNPFLMFRGPNPFFPPGFPPYPNLTSMFPAASPAQAPPFNLLFPNRNMDLLGATNNSEPNDRHTPPHNHTQLAGQLNHKISPSTGEEASGHLKPSPTRPTATINLSQRSNTINSNHQSRYYQTKTESTQLDGRDTSSYKTPRKSFLSVKDFSFGNSEATAAATVEPSSDVTSLHDTQKRRSEELDPLKQEHENREDETTNKKVKRDENGTPVGAEQPLDLSVTKKSDSISRTPSPVSPVLSIGPIAAIPEDQLSNGAPTIMRNSESTPSYQASPSPSVSPGPTPSPSPPPTNPHNDSLPMAYPRPMNPMYLDALYRPAGLGPFQRPFPFLGPIGRPGFDILSRNSAYPPKPFHEALMALPGQMINTMAHHHPHHHHHHKNKDRYSCKFCGKVFPRSANLTRHLRTHTGEQPYKCKYCERSFSISSNLQRHVRNIHNKERPFKCHLCERCFGQQTNLDRHLKKHEADATGLGLGVGDSPSSNEADRDDNYFDEFRSFFDKVTTYSGSSLYTPTSVGGGEIETEDGSDLENDIINVKDTLNNNDAAIQITT